MAAYGVKLREELKIYVVQALACFDQPSVVVASVKQEFGQLVSQQAVEGYDPNKRAGRKLSKLWRAIFEETRKTCPEDTAVTGISHRAVRLRALQRMADKAETKGNMVQASSLMEQAA